MTTIVDNSNRSKPQTHFFIVGVGLYRHVQNGDSPNPKIPRELKRLEQLSSAPTSAKAFANWAIKEFNNPNAPCGSVELLLSSTDQYTTPNGLQKATFRNIQNAFDKWYDRCNSHEENVAIFYFCGHGIQKDNLALLAEDFGKYHGRLFENAINFNMTYRCMASCQAKTQCYFIDSCRQVSDDALKLINVDARSLCNASVHDQQPYDAPVFYASSYDESAYGLSNRETRFTEALLSSLRGLGTKRKNGQWVVTTSSLADAVAEIIERGNKNSHTRAQHCKRGGEGSGRSIVHVLDKTPYVPVTINISPTTALSCAELALFKGSKLHNSRTPSPAIWQFNVAASTDYKAHVHFPTGQYYDPKPREVWALPPSVDEVFEVEAAS